MREYNGLNTTLGAVVRALALGAGLVLAGCAGQPTSPAGPPGPVPRDEAPPRAVAPPDLETADLSAQIRDDAPLRYVVKPGDTLWDIAGYYLRDPWYWPQLWNDNPDIDNPHRIRPGDVLVLSRAGDGQPRLDRGGRERLSPRIREAPVERAIPTIPREAIRAFLTSPRLVTEAELAEAPYIVSFGDEHLIGGEGSLVYVRGAPADGPAEYSVVHPAGDYRDPATDEILGQRAIPTGELQIRRFGDISTAVMTRSYREARPGNRLLPVASTSMLRDFHPHAPADPVTGRIMSVQDGLSAIGQYQVVTLNRGRRDGIERGHVLDIYAAGREVADPVAGGRVELPERHAGRLMVFKVDARVSFALIMNATRAIHVEDVVRSPAA